MESSSSSAVEHAARCATGVVDNIRRSLTSVDPSVLNVTTTTGTARDLEAHGAPAVALSDDDQITLTLTHTGSNAPQSPQTPPPATRPRTFMTLPNELQLMIIRRLSFTDIESLRQTCSYFHAFASPAVIRALFGPENFRKILISHCRLCLRCLPRPFDRLRTTPKDAGYPLSSRCVACVRQARDGTVRVGKKIVLGNYVDYWVCRWCGWPVTTETANGHVQFHIPCYGRYANVLLFYFCLGWVQLSFGITASALCWRYFRHDVLVFAPATVNFLLMWFCIGVLLFRGSRMRTYHWAFFVELAIAGIWIAPFWRLIQLCALETSAPRGAYATMVMIAGNMLSRLLNILGNAILFFEYDRTNHYIPEPPLWRRLVNPWASAFIFWTYPQAIEQKPKHGSFS